MDKKVSTIIVAVCLVAAAGGVSFGFKALSEKSQAEQDLKDLQARHAKLMELGEIMPQQPEPIVAMSDGADADAIAQLRQMLNERDAELASLQDQLQGRRNNFQQQQQPGLNVQDRIAQMQEENPEQYAEMAQRVTEAQEQVRDEQFQRLNRLAELDTSMMTEQELANHTELVERMSAMWELTANYDIDNPPDPETMRDAFGAMRGMDDMMEMERNVMFKQLGTSAGLSAAQAEQLSSSVQEVLETTTMQPTRGGMMGGMMGGMTGGMPGGGRRGGR